MPKKLIITDKNAEPLSGYNLEAFFTGPDDKVYRASGLPFDLLYGVGEGHAAHAPPGTAVACVNLQTCSGVFYFYSTGDVVAFHSPGGELKFKGSGRSGSFGTAAAEAMHYKIGSYSRVRVVIAAGDSTFNYPKHGKTRKEHVEYYLNEAYERLLSVVSKGVAEADIAFYVNTDGIFGVNAQGHVGESGRSLAVSPTVPETVSKTTCCFLTTAVCTALGKDNDCDELETLRWYRDQVLPDLDGGSEAIRQYRQLAPQVVAAIDRESNARERYATIYSELILPALEAIAQGRYEHAFRLYRDQVLALSRTLTLPEKGPQ